MTANRQPPDGSPPSTWASLPPSGNCAAAGWAPDAEFPADASLWPQGLSRRRFLELMGASLALAGGAGCAQRSKDAYLPPVAAPGDPGLGYCAEFATAVPIEGFARGVLVRSQQGRPVKIEGNPAHPDSLGATDAITQAAILSLYDPDRSRAPRCAGQPSTWEQFEGEWLARRPGHRDRQGLGLALLTEPTTSPSLRREIVRWLDRFPRARWFQHNALERYDRDGVQPDYDLDAAEVVLSLGQDFLQRHPAALRHARAFARQRRVHEGGVNFHRLYVLEPTPTVTGSMADFRLPVAPARQLRVLEALDRALAGTAEDPGLTLSERAFVGALAADWRAHAPRVLCVAPEDDLLEAWAAHLNARSGARTVTLHHRPAVRSDGDPRASGGLPELAGALAGGTVTTLLILGANPVYTAPADLRFAPLLARVPDTVHLGPAVDETAALCRWHLPESDWLETWGDLRAFDGTATILQPLIEPLYSTRSALELLRLLTDPPGRSGYELVRETWQEAHPLPDFETAWLRWLNEGVVTPSTITETPVPSPALRPKPGAPAPAEPDSLTVLFRPDVHLADGRWANNAWLQELPQPFTRLVWDNAALISPGFAARWQLADGDVIALEVDGRRLEAPVWRLPGQAENCVTLPLGRGRWRVGRVGRRCGFNAYALQPARARWLAAARWSRTGRHHALVSTQHHFTMDGRDLVRVVTAEELGREPPAPPAAPSLYPSHPLGDYAWGMSIDLGTCLGCNACVVACQAENNSPVVGRDQVARGREMHWIRIDRYYQGDPANPRFLHQPVPCMQCEDAPCELVCPVGATVHSTEGLNEMVFNRCVGTRYCSNNCPYKVRRFNFLDFREPADSPLWLQKNPEVTVRSRGVMEKCTYCVQRINAARATAEKENRRIRDGEVRTACQQACPAEAIVFGDLRDPDSRVARRKRERSDYALLAELNTRPRTTYLPRVAAPLPFPPPEPPQSLRARLAPS